MPGTVVLADGRCGRGAFLLPPLQIPFRASLADFRAGLPLPAARKGQVSQLCGLCSGAAPSPGFARRQGATACHGRTAYPHRRFVRSLPSLARSPDLIPADLPGIELNKIERRIVMKKLLTSLTVAALMALTIGATFASPKAGCCNGGSCCGSDCCHSHHNK